eukprot:TRINITY_DN1154_c0_g1_i1.p1 TRINITY_DN1154_c0_g1~~TRINITY_DN1154_c0_g1_i1.p1  ORF type:complete len:687 (-),score=169.25 TRINITY_DN1154_c0_g1_i1:68-2128(-)
MASDQKCINTIRCLAADTVQKAKSGHPGAPMGMAPMAHILWSKIMNYNPASPHWFNRDRFVLSNGHACALQYCMLYLTGYQDMTLKELQSFRQVDSKTPGHPESHMTDGIEVSTGPLGQGFANAVGLAIAAANYAAVYNKPGFENLLNNYTYVFTGDGCLQEGVSCEASSLAGHLKLGNLIVLYDDNHITIDGETELSFTEDVVKRFDAYGWHTQIIEDGDNDFAGIERAIRNAQQVKDKPSFIKVRTTIGIDSSKAGTEKAHGSPLGDAEIEKVKAKYGFDPKALFNVDQDVADIYSQAKQKGKALESEWQSLFGKYQAAFPDLAKELERRMKGEAVHAWREVLPTYKPTDAPKSTRALSQICIQKLAPLLPEFIGGSADLNPSTLTYMECSPDFQPEGLIKGASFAGRNIRFGVREHAMAAVCNGLSAFGGIIPYCSTFLNFIQYCLPAVRLSALSRHGVIYIMTHDSIGLGEDGPTHQPIAAMAQIRATPHIIDIRPADGNETSGAYVIALQERDRPSVLALCRQDIPQLPGSSIESVAKGAYTLVDHAGEGKTADVILIGSGSETHLCVNAAAELAKAGVNARVVSMPSHRLFGEQPVEYREKVLLTGVPVLSVEASSTYGWSQFAHAHIGMEGFGTSGPAPKVFEKFGFTADNIANKAKALIAFYKSKNHPVPDLVHVPKL